MEIDIRIIRDIQMDVMWPLAVELRHKATLVSEIVLAFFDERFMKVE